MLSYTVRYCLYLYVYIYIHINVCVYCFYTYVYIIMYAYIYRLSGECGVADKYICRKGPPASVCWFINLSNYR